MSFLSWLRAVTMSEIEEMKATAIQTAYVETETGLHSSISS